MKRAVCLLGLVAINANLWAQDASKAAKLSDPVEILKKADEASKLVKSYRYTASSEALFGDAERLPKVTGKLTAVPPVEKKPAPYRCEAKVTRPGSSDVEDVITGCDGDNFFVIDAKNKKAYVDVDPAVLGSLRRTAGALRMAEYGHETPFSDEIAGKKQEFKGMEKVGEEECYHVFVEYSQAGLEADWYFSTKDFLPRRVDRARTDPTSGKKGGSRLIVTELELELNPKVDATTFKLTVPEGFTKVDDFAP